MHGTTIRRWIAALLTLVATAFVLTAVLAPIQVCDNVLAGESKLELCARPSLEALAIAYVPALLLLLPDISELGFLTFSLKRQLEETSTDAKQAQADAKDAQVTAQVTAGEVRDVQATVGASILPAARDRVTDDRAAPPAEAGEPADRDSLLRELTMLWERRLRPFERLARRRKASDWADLEANVLTRGEPGSPPAPLGVLDVLLVEALPSGLTETDVEKICRWAEQHRAELEFLELTYTGAVGAGPLVDDDDVRQAIAIGERLRQKLPGRATA